MHPLDKKRYYKNKQESIRLRKYGITQEDFNTLFIKQKGCCAICGKHETDNKQRLAIDHCHNTGKIRGLLCIKCNIDLGTYERRKKEFKKYLQEW